MAVSSLETLGRELPFPEVFQSNATYQYCFAGVPLSFQLQERFVRMSLWMEQAVPTIELMHPRAPGHVTAVYCNELAGSQIVEVARVLEQRANRLKGERLQLGRVHVSTQKRPTRYSIKVEAPDTWYRFCEEINDDLGDIANQDMRGFLKEPHITIGKARGRLGLLRRYYERFLLYHDPALLSGSFPIEKLVVWGMDASDPVKQQYPRAVIDPNSPRRNQHYRYYSSHALKSA
jgi:hypothetical protein